MKRKLLVLLAILAVTCWGAVAAADEIFLTITQPNANLSGAQPPPYAFVDIQTTGTNATVIFSTVPWTGAGSTALTAGYVPGNTYFLGAAQMCDLNLIGTAAGNTTLTSADFTNIQGFANGNQTTALYSGFGVGGAFSLSLNPANGVDGFGAFNVQIDGPNFNADPALMVTTVIFNVSNWPGLSNNSLGNSVAAHIGDNTPSPNQITGFATVPIPPSALLLGSGLLGIITLGVRRRKR